MSKGPGEDILNTTCPVFVAFFSCIWFRSQRDPLALGMMGVAFIGVWLILSPGHTDIKPGFIFRGLFFEHNADIEQENDF